MCAKSPISVSATRAAHHGRHLVGRCRGYGPPHRLHQRELVSIGKLDGKIAIITGASKGIGAGIARVFTEEGACVVLAARGNDVLQFAEELQAAGREAVGFRCNVSDAQPCKDHVGFTLKTYGTIDILDCNAGICTLSDFLTSDDAWRDAHIDINIKGVWNVCRAALPTMVRNNAGSVVIISSVTGDMVADPGEVAYATPKAALVGFTKALAREMAPHSIRVNCICPGDVQTPLVKAWQANRAPTTPHMPFRRLPMPCPWDTQAHPMSAASCAPSSPQTRQAI